MQDPSITSRSGTRAADPDPDPDPVLVEAMPDRVWRRPSFEFMRPRLSRWLALGLGSGLAPFAPGTFGTLLAWASFALLDPWLSAAAWWVLIAAGFGLGCWACDRTGRDLGVPDHRAIVWDEIVAFWAVLTLVPGTMAAQVAAFFLFRAFDVLKPPPIRHLDTTLDSGFGVMLDDAVAAFYTVLVFAAWWAWTT